MTEYGNIIFEMDQEEIKKLHEKIAVLESRLKWQEIISYEYWNALYQIRAFVDLWKRKRIPKIREQLDTVEVNLRFEVLKL